MNAVVNLGRSLRGRRQLVAAWLQITVLVATVLVLAACSSGGSVAQTTDAPTTADATTSTTGGPDEGGLREVTIEHDGIDRDYLLYAPSDLAADRDVPLVFAFHGYTSLAVDFIEYADFRPLADEHGFILVYPDGTSFQGDQFWDVGIHGGTADDVGFVSAMIEAVSKDFPVDEGRIYATGHSNGGMMSVQLACQLSDQIAAVAPVAGSFTIATRPD